MLEQQRVENITDDAFFCRIEFGDGLELQPKLGVRSTFALIEQETTAEDTTP